MLGGFTGLWDFLFPVYQEGAGGAAFGLEAAEILRKEIQLLNYSYRRSGSSFDENMLFPALRPPGRRIAVRPHSNFFQISGCMGHL